MRNWILVSAIFMTTVPLFVTRSSAQDKAAIQHSQGEKRNERHADVLGRSNRISTKMLPKPNSSASGMNANGSKQNPTLGFSGKQSSIQRSGQRPAPQAKFARPALLGNGPHRGSNPPAITGTGSLSLRNIAVNGTEIHHKL